MFECVTADDLNAWKERIIPGVKTWRHPSPPDGPHAPESGAGVIRCAKGLLPGTLARRLRPPRLQRVLLEGLRHDAPPRSSTHRRENSGSPFMRSRHSQPPTDVRVVAPLAGLHAPVCRVPQSPDSSPGTRCRPDRLAAL